LSEDDRRFDQTIASDVLTELAERAMRRYVIEISERARK
jgi:hypothetical protein